MKFAVLDQRRFGGGAAHVEADEVLEAHRGGDGLGADDACGRAALDDVHGLLGRRLVRHQAAARLHKQHGRLHAGGGEVAAQPGEIARDDRLDIGVDDSRGGALVLLDLRQDIEADAVRETRRQPLDLFLQQQLVRGIDEGVEEADGDCLNFLGEQAFHRRFGLGLAQRQLHLTRGGDPFRHRGAEIARHQRLGFSQARS